jgi:nitrile hydratase accessory protein
VSVTKRPPERVPDRPPNMPGILALERLVASLPEAGRIPRKDGDLAFDTPWQIRAFGIAVAAHRAGHYAWTDFQRELMWAIRDWEATPEAERTEWQYYDRWVSALEHLVLSTGLVDADAYEAKTQEYLVGKLDPKHH